MVGSISPWHNPASIGPVTSEASGTGNAARRTSRAYDQAINPAGAGAPCRVDRATVASHWSIPGRAAASRSAAWRRCLPGEAPPVNRVRSPVAEVVVEPGSVSGQRIPSSTTLRRYRPVAALRSMRCAPRSM